MKDIMLKRVDDVTKGFLNDGIEALLVIKGTDIRYLTGFTGEDGVAIVILTKDVKYLITDGRFITQAEAETNGFEIINRDSDLGLYGEAGTILNKLSVSRLALSFNEIIYSDFNTLSTKFKSDIVDSKPYIVNCRRTKDKFELELINQACKITQESFLAIVDKIKAGITEMDIRNLLEYEMKQRGSEEVAFATIIASGADNGANPHATVSHRKIQNGDMVTMDFGAKYRAYCSDMTRTIAVGEVSKELKEIYEVVKKAKEYGVSKLKVGVSAKEIASSIVSVIEESGYKLPHGPGHGFGFDIHENPFLGIKNEYELEENVVITIEPGIYVPGVGGVRIEDDYLITKDGYELLTPNVGTDLITI